MDIEALEKLIKGRRSVRKWTKQSVPDEVLKKAIELATWAPNGGNFQGWRFVAVKNQAVVEKMAYVVQAVANKIAAWPEAAELGEEMERFHKNAAYFKNAPVCIAVFVGKHVSMPERLLMTREAIDQEAKQILLSRRSASTAIQSAAAAVATLLLVLHSMGLGAVWLASPLLAKKELEAILKAPENMTLVCMVAAGYPDESPQRERRPVDEVLEFIR